MRCGKAGILLFLVHGQRARAIPLHACQARRRALRCVVRYGARALGGEVLWSGEREREVRLRARRCNSWRAEGSGAFRSLTPFPDEITGTCSDWSIAFETFLE